MTRTIADLDYANVVKRAFRVATTPQNLLVLFFGAAIVALGSFFSFFILAGPLGVGYVDACARMARGQRAELDDVIWRGFERLGPAVTSGFLLGAITTALLFVLLVPGLMAMQFAGLVYARLAFDRRDLTGMQALSETWAFALDHRGPLLIMGLIGGLIGGVLSLTVIGSVVAVAFCFLISVFTYAHYFADPADPRLPSTPPPEAAAA